MSSMPSLSAAKPPRVALILIALVVTIQLMRIGAWGLVGDVLGGKVAMEWLFPASMDVVVGVLALPIAAIVLWGRGLWAWTLVVAFFVLSFADHADFYSVVLNSTAPMPSSIGSQAAGLTMVSVLAVLELLALWGVTTRRVREHLLGARG